MTRGRAMPWTRPGPGVAGIAIVTCGRAMAWTRPDRPAKETAT
jgi:hypothetical protein